MPWQETQRFHLLYWEEFPEEEEDEEEEEEEEEPVRNSWLFHTREDALFFLGERINEIITLNQQHIPPVDVTAIQSALMAGETWETAVDIYIDVMSHNLGSVETITLDEVDLMVRS
jgi:hypothetical protein